MNTELSFEQQIVIESAYSDTKELIEWNPEMTVYDAVMFIAESLCGDVCQGVWFEDNAETLQAVKAYIWYLAQGSGNYFDGYAMGGPAPVEPAPTGNVMEQIINANGDPETAKDVEAWLVMRNPDYKEVKRTRLLSAMVCDMGLYFDQSEVNSAYGIPVFVHDGDLGCLALWARGNNGDPDCYIEYNDTVHELFED